MNGNEPAAFLSYARADDSHAKGGILKLCAMLSAEVGVQMGRPFPIFVDRNDIKWGENWRVRINESLEAATILIPIITPNYFDSILCRDELTRFLKRGGQDLVFPIHYIETPQLMSPTSFPHDKLAQALAARQWVDWRKLRFSKLNTVTVQRIIEDLAKRIRGALETSHRGSHVTVRQGWWDAYSDIPEAGYYVGLEDSADSIQIYDPSRVPQLFQTSDYARAVIRESQPSLSLASVERRVELCMRRQSLLQRDNPPDIVIVLDEAPLRRVVGGRSVMASQLRHLAEMASMPHVSLEILPFSAGERGTIGGFTIFSLNSQADPDVVYLELATGAIYLDALNEVAEYSFLFARLRNSTLDPDLSYELLLHVQKGL
jgi:hypothetical protein